MFLAGQYFYLSSGGKSYFESTVYGMRIVNIETSTDTRLEGAFSSTYFYSKSGHERYLLKNGYSDSPIIYEAEILIDDSKVSAYRADMSEVERKLFGNRNFKTIGISTTSPIDCPEDAAYLSSMRGVYADARFLDAQRIENGFGCVGYKVTIELSSNLLFKDVVDHIIKTNSTTTVSRVTLHLDTDSDEYIYPRLLITTGATGGAISFNTVAERGRKFKMTSLPPNTTIEINGKTKFITSPYYNNVTSYNFLRLLQGDNIIEISGDMASVKADYTLRKFVR